MRNYGILFRGTFEAESQPNLERMGELILEVYRQQPGFEYGVLIQYDTLADTYGSLVVFDSREHAAAAFAVAAEQAPRIYREADVQAPSNAQIDVIALTEKRS